jgi:hypothetical protein
MKAKTSLYVVCSLVFLLEQAQAVQFEPKGKAVADVLGTKQAFQKKVGDTSVFYAKGSDGKATKLAIEQHGTYEPNCTHTWIVGVDVASGSVTEVKPVEMSCPHAFPTKEESFLGQFKGKAVADADKLDKQIDVVAKATGSSKLAITAVKKSLKVAAEVKGQI